MQFPIRSVLLVVAALSASQVAPAQTQADSEPLIATGSSVLPTNIVLQPIANAQSLSDDRLAPLPAIAPEPAPEPETVVEDEPTVAKSASLAEKVAAMRSATPGSREVECLAVGIYFESKSEPLEGQLAVGQVMANRAASGRFPKTYCGVLFQRSQFSFVRGKSYPHIARGSRQWANAVAVAKIVDQDMHQSSVGKALFFHAKRVSPNWRLTRVASVGNHVFYR